MSSRLGVILQIPVRPLRPGQRPLLVHPHLSGRKYHLIIRVESDSKLTTGSPQGVPMNWAYRAIIVGLSTTDHTRRLAIAVTVSAGRAAPRSAEPAWMRDTLAPNRKAQAQSL